MAPKGAKAVASWLCLRGPLPPAERDKLTLVNDFWNRSVMSGEDSVIWGQPDYWATPLESLGKGAGDCEDYVIGKYSPCWPWACRPTSCASSTSAPASAARPAARRSPTWCWVTTKRPTQCTAGAGQPDLDDPARHAAPRPDAGVQLQRRRGLDKPAAPVDRPSRWRDLLQRMEREGIRP